MRLVNSKYGLDIIFKENRTEILILEDAVIMRDVVGELWNQYKGGEGSFLLSEGKILKIDRFMELIVNPFDLDFQSRKIVTALLNKMTEIGNEDVVEKNRINCELINLLNGIAGSINYPGITYHLDFLWADLFKMYGVKIENQEGFLSQIIEYMKVISEMCGISLLCFVNLKKYLSKTELLDLYKNKEYNKTNILLIESSESELIDEEHITIIDKDRCVIER